jgi:glycogen debranching enzyme
MYSGWGIRTLSTQERRANPIGYHLGTVWPHDNAVIAAGLRRYGFDREAAQVLDGLVQAARHFEHDRLPELFAGFSRRQFTAPVRYPVACHPQAWAAGSVPFLLATLLGLVPDGFEHRLHVVRPVLPVDVDQLDIRRIQIGTGRVSLRFRRGRNNAVEVEVLDNHDVDVQIEPQSQLLPD